MYKNSKKAFTFVELIVVVIILGILAVIGFTEFNGSVSLTRDSSRKSHMSNIFSSMEDFRQTKGSYPIPSETFNIINGVGNPVVTQGKLNKNVGLSNINEIPFDPKLDIPYLYSITNNKKEFQVALTLENNSGTLPLAYLKGSYKSVAKTVLPSIIIATGSTSDFDISLNKDLFIFNKQSHNLPYDFDGNTTPTSDGTLFTTLLEDAEYDGSFSQNSSFETCAEIKSAGKSIGDGSYDLRTSTGSLTGSGCTGM